MKLCIYTISHHFNSTSETYGVRNFPRIWSMGKTCERWMNENEKPPRIGSHGGASATIEPVGSGTGQRRPIASAKAFPASARGSVEIQLTANTRAEKKTFNEHNLSNWSLQRKRRRRRRRRRRKKIHIKLLYENFTFHRGLLLSLFIVALRMGLSSSSFVVVAVYVTI